MQAGTYDHIWEPRRSGENWLERIQRTARTRAYGLLNDETLVRLACERNNAAFDALVSRYRDRLYAMAFGSLGDEDAAGEALCDMVLAAFHDIDSFGAKCSPGTWLYLHGFRAVFQRMGAPPGSYKLEVRSAGTAPLRD